MKQLLLRVPDDIHRRLTARAARDGQSVNALATEILDAAVDLDQGDRRDRLRSRARSMGMAPSFPGSPVAPVTRDRILASTRGLGAVLDDELGADRERL